MSNWQRLCLDTDKEFSPAQSFSPFMILTGRTPCLRADNYLHSLTAEVDDAADVETTTELFMQKVKLIASIHENVLLNVG
jgi:hypothetical protein